MKSFAHRCREDVRRLQSLSVPRRRNRTLVVPLNDACAMLGLGRQTLYRMEKGEEIIRDDPVQTESRKASYRVVWRFPTRRE